MRIRHAFWFVSFVVGSLHAAVVTVSPGYNAWPMIQAAGEKLICTYSRGSGHSIGEGRRDTFARVSADGGKTWGEETVVAASPDEGEVMVGKGLDSTGAALFWVRCLGKEKRHDLYRTRDGKTFEKIASPKFDPFPMQVTDVFKVEKGLMCLWFATNYKRDAKSSWGTLFSADDGRTWTQKTVERGLPLDELPTEPSVAVLGGGRLLGIARTEIAGDRGGRQFQLASLDDGETWKKEKTNIGDVRISTPALVYDPATDALANYYYERGKGKVKRRTAKSSDVFAHPTAWPTAEVVAHGHEERPHDAGNVNVAVLDGFHYVAYYYGTRTNASVSVEAVKPARPQNRGLALCAGEGWQPFSNVKDILSKSALDFSSLGFVDAPAGKYGWLKAANGHAEFEKRPGVPARFWGVNLCVSANYLEPDEIERLTDRFVRLGYNAVRIHHHDDLWAHDPSCRDRLDRLIASCVRKGLYLTTDLYVSRKATCREIGLDRDGAADGILLKNLAQFYEPAYANWQAFAREFLTHVNPYTGRALVDEPAMPFLVLINESSAHSEKNWKTLIAEPLYRAEWKSWLEGERTKNPKAYASVDPDRIPEKGGWWDPTEENHIKASFSSFLMKRFSLRAAKWLREDLGVKALLSTENHGPRLSPVMEMRASIGGYVDAHWYLEHPGPGAKGTDVKLELKNANPILGSDGQFRSGAFARVWGLPMCVSEGNFCGPNEYRSMAGLLRGGFAAVQDWTGIWTFAYAHGREKALMDGFATPGRFDLALDPILQASDRLAILLFLRGDQAVGEKAFANAFGDEDFSTTDIRPLSATPDWSEDLTWRARLGVSFGRNLPADVRPVRAYPASARAPDTASSVGLDVDRTKGEITVVGTRTVAGYRAAGGRLETDVFKAQLDDRSAATVAAAALDGRCLADSRRILLFHLTDVVGDGIVFKDARRRQVLKFGSTDLIVRESRVKATLRLAQPSEYRLYALDTTGRRIRSVPTVVRGGQIGFVLSIDAEHPAAIYYELTAENPSSAWSYRYDGDTAAKMDVNARIAEVAARGGGRVDVPAGTWECDPIELKSNVELHLAAGAELLFTDDLEKYLPAVRTSYEGTECYNYRPLISAFGATNVALTGCGTIRPMMGRWETWRWNGQGTQAAKKTLTETWGAKDVPVEARDLTKLPGAKTRPPFIGLNGCTGVRLEGFALRDSPFWCIHLLNCADVTVRGLSVRAFLNNSDGIDVECSRDVLIEDCSFDQGDDVIVLKSGKDRDGRRRATPTENVTIRRCRAGSGHGFLVVGSECSGGVRNVTMEDCRVDGSLATLFKVKTSPKRGGFVENITMRRVAARTILDAVADVNANYALNASADGAEDVLTRICGLTVEDVTVGRAGRRCEIVGDGREPIRAVAVRNVKIGRCANPDVIENAEVEIR